MASSSSLCLALFRKKRRRGDPEVFCYFSHFTLSPNTFFLSPTTSLSSRSRREGAGPDVALYPPRSECQIGGLFLPRIPEYQS